MKSTKISNSVKWPRISKSILALQHLLNNIGFLNPHPRKYWYQYYKCHPQHLCLQEKKLHQEFPTIWVYKTLWRLAQVPKRSQIVFQKQIALYIFWFQWQALVTHNNPGCRKKSFHLCWSWWSREVLANNSANQTEPGMIISPKVSKWVWTQG